ncbi:unnamed protein product [Caenorhabditis brenneri]
MSSSTLENDLNAMSIKPSDQSNGKSNGVEKPSDISAPPSKQTNGDANNSEKTSDVPTQPAEQSNGATNGHVKTSHTKPLAKKQPPVHIAGARMVSVATNIRKLTLPPNQLIYQHRATINIVMRKMDGKEVVVEMSSSKWKHVEHEKDKRICRAVYLKAVAELDVLKDGGQCFYDGQATLWTLKDLGIGEEPLSVTLTEGVSRRKNFVRAQFLLDRPNGPPVSTDDIANTVHENPSLADRRLLDALGIITAEAPSTNIDVFTIKGTHHYLLDSRQAGVHKYSPREGREESSVGATKSIKTLEGRDGAPGAYMTTEMKATFFHESIPVIEKLRSFAGFHPRLRREDRLAERILANMKGMIIQMNYGQYKNLGIDGILFKITGFGAPPKYQTFNFNGQEISVDEYFNMKHGLDIHYKDLMTIEAKGSGGTLCYFPPEYVLIAPNQTVTREQMINGEEQIISPLAGGAPHFRRETTENVSESIGLISENMAAGLSVTAPLVVDGYILKSPVISRDSQFVEPMTLSNWAIVFIAGEEIPPFANIITEEMRRCGMRVNNPEFLFISPHDLSDAFIDSKKRKRELLLFITKMNRDAHKYIKAAEQRWDVLTQHILFETVMRIIDKGHKTTLLGCIQKINMKLGGLNYLTDSTSLDEKTIVLGFATSQKPSGYDDTKLVAVGFASNCLDDTHKFLGGYKYVENGKDVYGEHLGEILETALKAKNRQSKVKPQRVIIYFHGINEAMFPTVRNSYVEICEKVFYQRGKTYKPELTIIASTKLHNERLYMDDRGEIRNLEPGTVVSSVIVSPVYNEFFHTGNRPFRGTTKPTKYTVVYAPEPVNMEQIQTLTNDLCYDSQIIRAPISVPTPIHIAMDCAERGSAIMFVNQGPYLKRESGAVDYWRTNEEYTYIRKNLGNTRFNA